MPALAQGGGFGGVIGTGSAQPLPWPMLKPYLLPQAFPYFYVPWGAEFPQEEPAGMGMARPADAAITWQASIQLDRLTLAHPAKLVRKD